MKTLFFTLLIAFSLSPLLEAQTSGNGTCLSLVSDAISTLNGVIKTVESSEEQVALIMNSTIPGILKEASSISQLVTEITSPSSFVIAGFCFFLPAAILGPLSVGLFQIGKWKLTTSRRVAQEAEPVEMS